MTRKSYIMNKARLTAKENTEPLTEEEYGREIDKRKIEIANRFMIGYMSGFDAEKILELCRETADEYLVFAMSHIN